MNMAIELLPPPPEVAAPQATLTPAPRLPARPRSVAELQRTISASRLGLWQQCRLKFYFKYVLGLVKPPTPARHVGSVVHAVLQAWNKARWRRETFVLERFKLLFDQGWNEKQKPAAINWDGE